MFPASTKDGGVASTAGPLDVCKMPGPPAPFVPVPYANMVDGLAASGDEAGKRTQKKIISDAKKIGINAKSATSAVLGIMGNEAGTLKGGIVSNKNIAGAQFIMSSSKIKAEGKSVTLPSTMTSRSGSSSNAPPGQQVAPSQTKVIIMGG